MKKLIALAATTALIALTGCTTDEPATKPAEQSAQAAEATTPAPEKPTVEPTEENAENTNVKTGDTELFVGDTFEFGITNMDAETTYWHIAITDVETVDALPEIDATPKAGNEFIHATYETTNIQKRPDSIMLSAGVAYADGTLMAPVDADAYSMDLTNLREDDAGAEQNPNTTHTGDFVIEVPQGAEVTHLVIDAFPGGTGEYWVALP